MFKDGQGGHAWNHVKGDQTVFWAQSETTLSPADREARRKRAEELRAEAEAERRKRAVRASALAKILWGRATDPTDNPYMSRKCVQGVATLRQIDAAEAAAVLRYTLRPAGTPCRSSAARPCHP